MPAKKPPISIRISDELQGWIASQAAEREIAFNAFVVELLERGRQTIERPPPARAAVAGAAAGAGSEKGRSRRSGSTKPPESFDLKSAPAPKDKCEHGELSWRCRRCSPPTLL